MLKCFTLIIHFNGCIATQEYSKSETILYKNLQTRLYHKGIRHSLDEVASDINSSFCLNDYEKPLDLSKQAKNILEDPLLLETPCPAKVISVSQKKYPTAFDTEDVNKLGEGLMQIEDEVKDQHGLISSASVLLCQAQCSYPAMRNESIACKKKVSKNLSVKLNPKEEALKSRKSLSLHDRKCNSNKVKTNQVINKNLIQKGIDKFNKGMSHYDSVPILYSILGKKKLCYSNSISTSKVKNRRRLISLNKKQKSWQQNLTNISKTPNNVYMVDNLTVGSTFNCSVLIRFEPFLLLVEECFNEHLKNIFGNDTLKIDRLLYAPEFVIVEGFKTNIFGDLGDTPSKMLERLSSTFDVLNSFFDTWNHSPQIIYSLRYCVDPNIEKDDFVELAKQIEKIFIAYLKSIDAKYILGFLPELKSYVNLPRKIEINYDKNVINGIIVFLFLLKRIELNIKIFKIVYFSYQTM